MPNFTLERININETINPIYKLCREGKCLLDEFIAMVKSDLKLEPLLGDLFAAVRYVADGKSPPLPEKRMKKIKGQNDAWEARKGALRMYVKIDNVNGAVIIIGGDKSSQNADLKRLKNIIKEFSND